MQVIYKGVVLQTLLCLVSNNVYGNHTDVVLHTLMYLISNNESTNNEVESKYISPPAKLRYAQEVKPEATTAPETTPCYGVFGCFPTTAPWSTDKRQFPFYPESPDKVNPRYCLRTRMNPDRCQFLEVLDEHTIYRSYLLPDRKVFFVIHGYLEGLKRSWMQRMNAELLKMDDVNVITVDWSGGSSPPYAQAVANIRLVGTMTAHLILTLIREVGLNVKDVHIIGHSLGAHTASYVGSVLQTHGHKLGRITGLDAAEPRFSDTDPLVRLDPTDADFVDAIHTDAAPFMAGGLGIREPVGHVDFYPNGGRDQPGCAEGMSNFISEKGSVLRGLEKFLNCNHVRSNEFFIESINSNCSFAGVQCHSWEAYKEGNCFSCAFPHAASRARKGNATPNTTSGLGPRCARMGMHARDSIDRHYLRSGRPMKVFLMTAAEAPLCRNQYRVTLRISNSSKSVTHGGEVGIVSLLIKGTDGNTLSMQLNDRERYHEPGSTHRQIIVGSSVGRMESAILSWDYTTSVFNPLTWRLLMQPRIHVASVTVDSLETGDSMTITPPDGTPLISKKPLECWRNKGDKPGECQIKLISTLM